MNLISKSHGQPDSRFRPFDWVLYKSSGSVLSIAEGYNYAYFGTSSGGIKRFNLFNNNFDYPLTEAQGLKKNEINAVHFDKKTGFLWAATPEYVQYSFSREGDWYPISLSSLGLSRFDVVSRIGSTESFIWLQARSSFVKLDNSSGTLVGIFSRPDEQKVQWSSGPYVGQIQLREILNNYHFLESWVYNGAQLIDAIGRVSLISTGFIGNHKNIYFGSDTGTIFYGTSIMQTLTPLESPIANDDISSLTLYDDTMWIGSKNYILSKGISKMNMQDMSTELYAFEETINMQPTSVYSLKYLENELWAGGERSILYYNLKDNFWRTLGEVKGVPSGLVYDLEADETHLWVATSDGFGRIERATLSSDPLGIEDIFVGFPIYDMEKIEDQLWLGTSRGVFIFYTKNPQVLNINSIGRKTFPDNLYNVSSIKKFKNIVYIVSDKGVVTFDLESKEWVILFRSGMYSNKDVYSMTVNDKFIFLGLEDGLVRINKTTGIVRDYPFSFIGQVNDIVIDEKNAWLGTANGLINFKWRRDL